MEDQSTDLESGKKSLHKEGAHGGKLTVSKTCSECHQCSLLSSFISPVVIFAFTTGEVMKDKFFLGPFFDWNKTTAKLLGNFQNDFALGQQITESPLVL